MNEQSDLRSVTIMLRVIIGLLIVVIVLLLLIGRGVRRADKALAPQPSSAQSGAAFPPRQSQQP